MGRQGCVLTDREVQRIITLLSSTDMTIAEIAQRMSCSRSVIISVNRRFQIRHYAGLRSMWTVPKLESN
jgi:hypothetical protein